MADRDSAEWTDQIHNLHIKDVNLSTLECSAFQKHLPAVFDALLAMHHQMDLWVGPSTPNISSHHLDVIHHRYVEANKHQHTHISVINLIIILKNNYSILL